VQSSLQIALSKAISKAVGESFEISELALQSGGCINEAWIVSSGSQKYFVKLNAPDQGAMFAAEAEALSEILHTGTIGAPQPITHGVSETHSFLVLEALDLKIRSDNWSHMGRDLARLHRSTRQHFGWHRNNTIGSTPQRNKWADDWTEFFIEQRLSPQIRLALKNGHHFSHTEELLKQVTRILKKHRPEASLLHGDLWSGNAGFLDDGTPVIFDPATYYGDRETDIAFSEFFGGFGLQFYKAYNTEWPLEAGYESRKEVYNLYHLLNHLNLFGSSYAEQTNKSINSLLRMR